MRYFIGFLIVIGLIVLVFVLFLTGGSKTPKLSTPNVTSYSNTDTQVRFTIDGPITADQTHRAVQITVGQNEADIDIIQGYQNTVINHQSFANNNNAYDVFLHAINLAGYTKTRTTSNTDDRGVCPLGDRYIFEIINGADSIQRTWSTSCGGQGTFGGNRSLVATLFEDQIPNYGTITSNVAISPGTL